MAKLNLQPDFSLIVIQSGLFLINLYIVKRFFVSPFLLLKSKRDEATLARFREAEKQKSECDHLLKKIEARLNEALLANKKLKEEIINKALLEQKEILSKSREASSSHIRKIKEEIEKRLQEECNRIPRLVDGLAEHIYKEVVKK